MGKNHFNSSTPRNMEQFGNGGKNARTFFINIYVCTLCTYC